MPKVPRRDADVTTARSCAHSVHQEVIAQVITWTEAREHTPMQAGLSGRLPGSRPRAGGLAWKRAGLGPKSVESPS